MPHNESAEASSAQSPSLEHVRHSLAHLLAAAVLKEFPDAKLGIGPAIETGFYYDFQLPRTISADDLKTLEKTMRNLVNKKLAFTGREVTPDEARTLFAAQPFKRELIDEFAKDGKTLTVYETGLPGEAPIFIDLCRGGHTENTAAIAADAFKLDKVAGAYWRGDENNPQLQRIYGLAFQDKATLDAYLAMRAEAEKRDHKKLGRDLDLFLIDDKVGKGLPMWTPKGTIVKFALENFARELERKYGYEHVATPYLGGEELYRISGHLDHYAKNMYAPIDMDGDKFYLRPMACPHHIRMYQRRQWSYKELPVRYAEIADYNRYEKSGELMGMIRVRKFQLTDGHLFVTPEGLKEEFKKVCEMIVEGMHGLGLSDIVSYRFSKRDPENKEKYYPDDELWDHAEGLMKEALDELGLSYVEAQDEAAFYGPKLDVQAKNVNGKEDTLFTAQMDFLLPQKFNVEYIDAEGEKKHPVMIHRSTIGSLERIFGFLIEHFAGAFPVWLAPVQVAIIPVSDAHAAYAEKVKAALETEKIRMEIKPPDESLGKRIRAAELAKIPYSLVVGEKEMNAESVNVRSYSKNAEAHEVPLQTFIDLLKEEIVQKKLQ